MGLEAAFLFGATHTVANNAGMVPTTMLQQFVVASFNDSTNFGQASSMLGESNGEESVSVALKLVWLGLLLNMCIISEHCAARQAVHLCLLAKVGTWIALDLQ